MAQNVSLFYPFYQVTQESTMFKNNLVARHAPVWLLSLTLALALGAADLAQAQPGAAPEALGASAPAVVPSASAAVALPNISNPAITPPASDAMANPYGLRSVWAQGDLSL